MPQRKQHRLIARLLYFCRTTYETVPSILVQCIFDIGSWQDNRTGVRTLSMPGA